jgi:hypothetical protein
MAELAEYFLLLDGGDESFLVPEIEDYEITGNFESSPASLSPPIDMNRPGKQVCVDFSDAIDARFRKRMEFDETALMQEAITAPNFTFGQAKRRAGCERHSLLQKAFTPEQLSFHRRLAARKSAKQNNRHAMTDSVETKDPSAELGPFICIW